MESLPLIPLPRKTLLDLFPLPMKCLIIQELRVRFLCLYRLYWQALIFETEVKEDIKQDG